MTPLELTFCVLVLTTPATGGVQAFAITDPPGLPPNAPPCAMCRQLRDAVLVSTPADRLVADCSDPVTVTGFEPGLAPSTPDPLAFLQAPAPAPAPATADNPSVPFPTTPRRRGASRN